MRGCLPLKSSCSAAGGSEAVMLLALSCFPFDSSAALVSLHLIRGLSFGVESSDWKKTCALPKYSGVSPYFQAFPPSLTVQTPSDGYGAFAFFFPYH